MRKIIIILAFISANTMLFAQNADETSEEAQNNLQTGQSSPSLYTGGMSFSVPIYTIQDPDFTLPISMTYVANGFMSAQTYDVLGNNWHLNAGSSVTRKVFGMPDEASIKKHRNGETFLDRDNFFNGVTHYSERNFYYPDIFSFNINGVSGWFYIDFNGEVKVVSNEYFTVDLSKVDTAATKRNATIIKIIDNQGYSYVYGGDATLRSYSANYLEPDTFSITEQYSTDEWYLAQIIAPNGRKMNFKYESRIKNNKFEEYYKATLNNFIYPSIYDNIGYGDYCNKYSCDYDYINSKTGYGTQTPILTKIEIPDVNFEMQFNYIEVPYSNKFCNLSSINLNINGNVLKGNFYYVSKTVDGNVHRYLTKYKTFQNTKYSFEYNFDNPPADYLNDINLKDAYGYDRNNPFYGTLKKITNTMGGITEFEYERHHFRMMKIFNKEQPTMILEPVTLENRFLELYNNIRIKKIKKFDENYALIATKEYIYLLNEPTNLSNQWQNAPPLPDGGLNYITLQSSGILHNDFASKLITGNYEVWDRILTQNSEPLAVTYSKVTEKISYPTGKEYKTVYYFSEYEEMPDILATESFVIDGVYSIKNFYGFTSMSKRRGLLNKKEEFEGENTLKRISEYIYQPINDYLLYYGQCKMFFGSSNITNINVKNYINGTEIVSNTEFRYDSKNRLTEHNTTGANGKINFTKYRYADDIVQLQLCSANNIGSSQNYSGFLGGFQQIQRQGWFGRPVEVLNGYYENGNKNTPYYTSGTISVFGKQNENGGGLNQIVYLPTTPAYYLSNPLPYVPKNTPPYATLAREMSLALEEPITNYQQMTNNNGTVKFDENYIKVADYEYNDMLRLTKLKPANVLETTYVWDTKNLYPVSETTGQFKTSFTYKPMVGKTSETDSRGIKIIYEYDKYGRLIEVKREKNGETEILQKYEYHIGN